MRIALATVGTTGDVRPFAALASALAGHGHDVTALSWELHADAFAAYGVRFAAVGPATTWDEIRRTAREAAAARTPQEQVVALRDFHLRDGAAHYRALRGALPGHDLVVLHGIHSLAEAAARDAGVAYATAVFDPILLPTREHPPAGMPQMGPLNRAAWWFLDRMLTNLGRPLDALLRDAGSASAGRVQLFRARSPLRHLVACSPVLAPPPADLASQVAFTGAWMPPGPPDAPPTEVEGFIDDGPAPVVVSFGSMATDDPVQLGAVLAEALEQARARAIVQRGAAELSPAAAGHRLLVTGELDHRAVFPRASLVVHHGGAGTSHAAAAAGVPSVVVPHVGDQSYWAQRLHRLGAAPEPLPVRQLDATKLADRITEASTDRIRDGARGLSQRMAGEGGLERAIGLLEEAVASA